MCRSPSIDRITENGNKHALFICLNAFSSKLLLSIIKKCCNVLLAIKHMQVMHEGNFFKILAILRKFSSLFRFESCVLYRDM